MTNNNEEQPLVSVGIPTYNRPSGLRRTLECITQQTYPNLEIIVSDNCSPDVEVAKVVQSFIELDHRIKYFRQPENIGAGNNFKFVLEKSSGEYFMWAADDDEWHPDYIKKLLFLLIANPNASVAFSNFQVVINNSLHEFYKDSNFSNIFFPFSNQSRLYRYVSYICQDGSLGKANIIYGLVRTKIARSAINCFSNLAFSDCFYVAFLLWNGYLCIENSTLYKVNIQANQSDSNEPVKVFKNVIENYSYLVNIFFLSKNYRIYEILTIFAILSVANINEIINYIQRKFRVRLGQLKKAVVQTVQSNL
jgi:glycosyltransferase involved in cell wall biosynthesis